MDCFFVLFSYLKVPFIFVDRVFGPTTTTRHVYDVAAQHAVNGAMEGINGTKQVRMFSDLAELCICVFNYL